MNPVRETPEFPDERQKWMEIRVKKEKFLNKPYQYESDKFTNWLNYMNKKCGCYTRWSSGKFRKGSKK